jgi:hypothetical protein
MLLGNTPPPPQMKCVIPAPRIEVQTKMYSKANVFSTTQSVPWQAEEYCVEDIIGFWTCKYEIKWWLAYVLQVNDSKIQVAF